MSTDYESMQVEKWGNVEDVADYLRITQDTARTWAREGRIPAYKVGKRYKFKISEVDEWVRNNGSTSEKEAEQDE